MTDNASQTQQNPSRPIMLVAESNEWGQIPNLEPHTSYFVIRKPTREMTRERAREFTNDVRAFLHEHRVLTEKQFDELNQRYGEPAKQRAKEIRETLERRFDEIAKEIEARVEKLEKDYGFGRKEEPSSAAGDAAKPAAGETPGEMPTGEHAAAPDGAGAEKPTGKGGAKKAK